MQPAVEALTNYLEDPNNSTLQTAFLNASAALSTSTGTTYTPVSVFLNFAAVATNPSGQRAQPCQHPTKREAWVGMCVDP